ncbi:MAG TPA: hypothetical protein DD471_04980 [Planctomycetes bacterium]|nr:hypothetical protein [Planctomycetota bacterium]
MPEKAFSPFVERPSRSIVYLIGSFDSDSISVMKRTTATSPRSLALLLAMLLPGCKGAIDPAQLENLRDDLDAVVSGTRGAPPREDTNRDGWDTEVFSARAQGTLKALALLLDSPPGKGPEAGLLADDFQCSTLRPVELEETFRDQHFIVRRGNKTKSPAQRKGRAGLEKTFGELLAAFEGSSDRHSKLKLFEVETSGKDSARTRTYFQLSGRFSKGRFQVKATWRSAWKRKGEKWLLQELAAETYEETLSLGGEKPLFDDCTSSLLSTSSAFTSQLLPGLDHWMGRIELGMGIDIGGWQGLAVGDINGDGRDDLYVCQPGGLPNRLFVQNADGSVTERSAELGVDWLESTHGALFADLDNDGDQDLLAGLEPGVMVHENDGKGHFTPKAAKLLPAALPYSLAAADYDLDGDIDIYVCCYNRRKGANRHLVFARPVPYHDANNGGRNVLLRNDGSWRFSHATVRAGLDVKNRRFSYAAAWEDFDNDGDQDLYVANDFGRNNLYRNDSGRFTDITAAAGAEDISPGMSSCWGDYDNDGWMDLYVSNMFSSAGNRITSQGRFHQGASDKTRAEFRRHARGNTLLKNLGNGRFNDVSGEAGISIGRWAWGSKFADLNNDGWEDLLVTNGFITQQDTGDL